MMCVRFPSRCLRVPSRCLRFPSRCLRYFSFQGVGTAVARGRRRVGWWVDVLIGGWVAGRVGEWFGLRTCVAAFAPVGGALVI